MVVYETICIDFGCVVSSYDGHAFYFFFFKQKTAYEMRISDWSSDVCSSDLERVAGDPLRRGAGDDLDALGGVGADPVPTRLGSRSCLILLVLSRSEERRVGKEWVSTCRSRWSP